MKREPKQTRLRTQDAACRGAARRLQRVTTGIQPGFFSPARR